jgi:hypothetical protein
MKIHENAPVCTVDPNKVRCTLPAEEVARIKGMGGLWDKRTEDRFNFRVITVNGKITAEKMAAIAEAAKRFGSGEAAMTTRLTIEIQGVPYENIQPMQEYLAQFGLVTGGTGKKIRPVVSCKGTTCQFGLIDTYGLSEKIHKQFYEGYRALTLPHKHSRTYGNPLYRRYKQIIDRKRGIRRRKRQITDLARKENEEHKRKDVQHRLHARGNPVSKYLHHQPAQCILPLPRQRHCRAGHLQFPERNHIQHQHLRHLRNYRRPSGTGNSARSHTKP